VGRGLPPTLPLVTRTRALGRIEPDGSNALELVELPEQRGQPEAAGVGLDLGQQPAALDVAVSGDERLKPEDGVGREPLARAGRELLIAGLLGAGDHALDAPRGRRFDSLSATTRNQGLAPTLLGELRRTDLCGEPGGEVVLVGDGRLPEPEGRSDLGTVVLDGPARPFVVGEGLSGDLES
jgi:hypothetical protein